MGVNLGVGFRAAGSPWLKHASFIPLQAGVNYYLKESRLGWFIGAKAGVTRISMTYEDYDPIMRRVFEHNVRTRTYFSATPQVGYFITENISLAINYQMLYGGRENETYNNIGGFPGGRLAWNF